MRLYTLIITVFCLAGFPAFAGPLTKRETSDLRFWQTGDFSEDNREVAERGRIAKHATNVRKTPDSLWLKLRDKGWREFPFDPVPDDDSSTLGFNYVFLTHIASKHGYLIGILYYEGLDYLWIDDRNGQVTQFCCTAPIFSPDGGRMLILGSTAEGEDSEYTRLYKLQDKRMVLDRQWLIPGGDVALISWNDDRLRLKPRYASLEGVPSITLNLSTGVLE
ncbi:hypothetical protein ACFSM5_05850 [Lacibacterium aquatile]|uniref:Uncharacterized protein n=1 Tax=Lacibacterium aquatile TaxID=1168082 RepID=A0ABW5DSZ2_9PROT